MTNAEKFMEQHKLNLTIPKEINLIATETYAMYEKIDQNKLAQQWNQLLNRIKQEELLESNQPTETSAPTTPTTPLNEITVRILNKYGNDLIYPADHKAHIFADMLGQKTFTRTNIKYIKSLGFTIKQTFEEVKL